MTLTYEHTAKKLLYCSSVGVHGYEGVDPHDVRVMASEYLSIIKLRERGLKKPFWARVIKLFRGKL